MNSYEIDEKLEPVLRTIEANGVEIDVKFLEKLSQEIALELDKLTKEIYASLGHEFNLNSPSQLANVLYEKLKIGARGHRIKFGKTHFSTSAQSLEKIKHKHPAIEKILKYREMAKLKNTYIDPLPKLVDKNNRLHTHYAVDTSTGRLSSKNPNLQNIPTFAKATVGRPIRRAFIAEKGCKLLKADYSQIELRIIAHLSNDKEMIKTFQSGGDIHSKTAKELSCDRRTAKVVNFGVIYGMSAYGLAETLKISEEEAQFFIDKYFMTYNGVKKYIDDVVKKAQENGYTETMFGRKREIPELKSTNYQVRNFGIRAAINSPVQGTAAEVIKLAMLALSDKWQGVSSKYKMILQVHDELVFEVPNSEIKKVAKIVKDKMENVIELKVPLVVDLKIGDNWEDMANII